MEPAVPPMPVSAAGQQASVGPPVSPTPPTAPSPPEPIVAPHVPPPDATPPAPLDLQAIEAAVATAQAASHQTVADEIELITDQIESAETELAAKSAAAAGLGDQAATPPEPEAAPSPQSFTPPSPPPPPPATPIGMAMPPVSLSVPPHQVPAYQPLSPPLPARPSADQYNQVYGHAQHRATRRRWFIGVIMLICAALIFMGLSVAAALYVRRSNSTVVYSATQTINTNGTTGFSLQVPAEFVASSKSETSLEYTHRIPANKGSGEYGGVAVSSSAVTSEQKKQLSTLKDQLRNKDSTASQQFLQLVNNGSLAQQQVSLNGYIEKTTASGLEFFGYEITLSKNSAEVGKGWMVFTVANDEMYVVVVYATNTVWQANGPAWDALISSFVVND